MTRYQCRLSILDEYGSCVLTIMTKNTPLMEATLAEKDWDKKKFRNKIGTLTCDN